jgi:hypothetical protein
MVEIRVVRSLFGKERFIFEQGGFIRAYDNTAKGVARIAPERVLPFPMYFPETRERFVSKTAEFLSRARDILDRVITGEKPKAEFKGMLM